MKKKIPSRPTAGRSIPPSSLQEALALHRAGKTTEAEAAFQAILAREPRHFDALYWLALIKLRGQRPTEALPLLDRAIEVNPRSALALNARGSALRSLKQPEAALECYDRALAVEPDEVNVLNNRGNVLKDLGRHQDAIACYERAIAVQGEFPEAHFNRGLAFEAMGDYAKALVCFDQALGLRPNYAEAWNSRGIVLQNQKHLNEALASFEEALRHKPIYPDALSNRGAALHALERYDEALATYDRVVVMKPDHAEAFYNRGNTLRALDLLHASIRSFTRGIEIKPVYPEAYTNRGLVEQDVGDVPGAMRSFEAAIQQRPDHVEAHWNLSLALLVSGDLLRGFEKYEWRWKRPTVKLPPESHLAPRWTGEVPLAGKTILLRSEQGFGDTIQFCRYAALCRAQGARVVLEIQRDLVPLMRTLEGPDSVIARGDPLPPHDLQCPLLSLPHAFRTRLDSIPSSARYLAADPAKVAAWQARLQDRAGPQVGLVMSGSPTHGRDRDRSIALHTFMTEVPLALNWVSLQKECRKLDQSLIDARDDIRFFGSELLDFSDTAALVAAMDLVVTVDTSVAHLAGALGRPVWVMLPFSPDWRWLWHGEQTPWYPGMRVFRQPAVGDWNRVFARLKAELSARYPHADRASKR